jgi:hypothetical protein
MSRDDDQRDPDAIRAGSGSFAQGLTVLAQFHNEHTVLDYVDIAQQTGFSSNIAQQRLERLSALGYLTQASGGSYRLAAACDRGYDPLDEGSTPDAAA